LVFLGLVFLGVVFVDGMSSLLGWGRRNRVNNVISLR